MQGLDDTTLTAAAEYFINFNHATCNYEHGKYLASIMDDLAIPCDEIIESYNEEIKTIPTNFNEKKVTCKTQNLSYFC